MAFTLISSKSRTEWVLQNSPLEREKNSKLQWSALLPTQAGTKHQRAYLLGGSQELFEALFDDASSRSRKAYSSSTVKQKFTDLKALVRWMVARGIWRFSQLNATDILEFFQAIKSREAGPPSERTIDNWIRLFKRMWELRTLYRGGLRFDVSELRDEIKATVRQRHNRPWKAFEEQVTMAIIRDALQWLEDYGPFLTEATSKAWEDFDRMVGLTASQRSLKRIKFYAALEQHAVMQQLRSQLGVPTHKTHKVLSLAVTATEGACISLLLLLLGLRASELCALNTDCVKYKQVNGDLLPYVEGIAAKKSGQSRHWVAAEPVPTIVRFLIDFNHRARTYSKHKGLLLVRPVGSPISLPKRRLKRFTPERMGQRMRAFVFGPFRDGGSKPKRCHPHMARKSFAKLAVLRDKTALEPVSHQLGHAFKWFTDGAYVGTDHELSELLAEEDRKELAAALTDLLSRPVAGKAGAALAEVAARTHFRGKRGLSRLVESLISKGVMIAPCDWGYCVYDESLSACRGDSSGPNERNRSPEVCASCQNFGVTRKHHGWWNERAQRESSFLQRPGLTEQTRKVVEIRLDTSNRILRSIVALGSATASVHVQMKDAEQ